jgi:hypothetical protein
MASVIARAKSEAIQGPHVEARCWVATAAKGRLAMTAFVTLLPRAPRPS